MHVHHLQESWTQTTILESKEGNRFSQKKVRMPLSTLPIEILGEILSQLDSPESLCSAILTSRIFYTAYLEHKESIDHALWRNTYAECEIYCRFLTHVIANFLPSRAPDATVAVPGSETLDFFLAYVNWANPLAADEVSKDFVREELPALSWEQLATIPTPKSGDMIETHEYILRWSKRFCEARLKCHGFTKRSLPDSAGYVNRPPTRTELTRVCASFYQFWIYAICYSLPTIDLGTYFEEKDIDMPHGWDDGATMGIISHCIAESISFREFIIIKDSLAGWIKACGSGVVDRMSENEEYLKMCRNRPDQIIGITYLGEYVPVDKNDDALLFTLLCNLGPKASWKFLFESTFDEEIAISLSYQPVKVYSWFWEQFGLHKQDNFSKDYSPILRVCRRNHELMENNKDWWGVRKDNGLVDKSVVMWDDWRLKEWGFLFPALIPPILFYKITNSEKAEGVLKAEYVQKFGRVKVIIEKKKEFGWRNLLFRRLEANMIRNLWE
ncbi:hypothetical protein TWF730_002034 [Orbilia blumenaviensis]|uniref:F-box domain-containing protein n=1 Tax=Orbilia blumenaviensis TaxID=1796055 RepID=A0AAV9UEA4_9PEZI